MIAHLVCLPLQLQLLLQLLLLVRRLASLVPVAPASPSLTSTSLGMRAREGLQPS